MSDEGFRDRVRSAMGAELPNAPAPLERLLAPTTESRIEHVRVEEVVDRDWFLAVDRTEGTYRGLRSSVRASGVLQPLLLRRRPDGWLQVVSGARRLQAARDTAQDTVPSVVRDLSDVEALVGSWDVVLRRGVSDSERAALERRLVDGGMPAVEASTLVSTAPELGDPSAAALLLEPVGPGSTAPPPLASGFGPGGGPAGEPVIPPVEPAVTESPPPPAPPTLDASRWPSDPGGAPAAAAAVPGSTPGPVVPSVAPGPMIPSEPPGQTGEVGTAVEATPPSPWPTPGGVAPAAPGGAAEQATGASRAPWSFGSIPRHDAGAPPSLPAGGEDGGAVPWPAAEAPAAPEPAATAEVPQVDSGATTPWPAPEPAPTAEAPQADSAAADPFAPRRADWPAAADGLEGRSETASPLLGAGGRPAPAGAAELRDETQLGPMIAWPDPSTAAASAPTEAQTSTHTPQPAAAPEPSPAGWPSPGTRNGDLAPTSPPEPVPIDPVLFPLEEAGVDAPRSPQRDEAAMPAPEAWAPVADDLTAIAEPAAATGAPSGPRPGGDADPPAEGLAAAEPPGGFALDAPPAPSAAEPGDPASGGLRARPDAAAPDPLASHDAGGAEATRSPAFGWPTPTPTTADDAGRPPDHPPDSPPGSPYTPQPWWSMGESQPAEVPPPAPAPESGAAFQPWLSPDPTEPAPSAPPPLPVPPEPSPVSAVPPAPSAPAEPPVPASPAPPPLDAFPEPSTPVASAPPPLPVFPEASASVAPPASEGREAGDDRTRPAGAAATSLLEPGVAAGAPPGAVAEPVGSVFTSQRRRTDAADRSGSAASTTERDDRALAVPVTGATKGKRRVRPRRRGIGSPFDAMALTVLGISLAVGALAFAGISALVGDGGRRLVVAGAVALIGLLVALLNARRALGRPGE